MADAAVTVRRTPAERWSVIATPSPQAEDRLSQEVAAGKWQQIYHLFNASGEKARDEVFAAVQFYFLRNGCSPNGKYSRDISTAGGISVQAAEVVKIVGRLDGEIRQFLRAKMKDSFNALKHSPLVQTDEQLRTRAEERGIPRDFCYLLADWLRDCDEMNAEEARLSAAYSVRTISDANSRYKAAGKNAATTVSGVVAAQTPEEYSSSHGYNNHGVGELRNAAY